MLTTGACKVKQLQPAGKVLNIDQDALPSTSMLCHLWLT